MLFRITRLVSDSIRVMQFESVLRNSDHSRFEKPTEMRSSMTARSNFTIVFVTCLMVTSDFIVIQM